jgi:hypothetical protein
MRGLDNLSAEIYKCLRPEPAPEPAPASAPIANDAAARYLLELAQFWNDPCPFSCGDLIVPSPGSRWQHVGVCMVLRVAEFVEETVDGHTQIVSSSNMRVLASMGDGRLHELAAHSRDFRPYTGDAA